MSRVYPLVCGLLVVALLSACRAGGERATDGADVGPSSEEPALDWVLFYYMAYDNDLDWAATPIFAALRAGLESERIAVVTIADGHGPGGMTRTVLTHAGAQPEALPTEASAALATLEAELAWVGEHLPARRYAVILLDHGGRLDEIGLDSHPEEGGPSWLRLPEVADALRVWREQLAGEVELVMLQQCGKGSVENLYELRGAARYLLASEVAVGAPNGYYTGTLRYLAEHPGARGLELARVILAEEPEIMFGAYSVVDGAKLDELPGRLEAVLEPLVARGARLRGPGWDLLREWVRFEGADGAEVDVPVATSGRYLLSTLSTAPVLLSLFDSGGREIAMASQAGAFGGVDRLVRLEAGGYRVQLRPTAGVAATGPVLLRLVPGPPLPTVYRPAAGEEFVDLADWLESLYLANGLNPAPVDELRGWLERELVVGRRVSASFTDVVASSGVSVLRPASVSVLEEHADYGLYGDTSLARVWRLLHGERPQ